MKRRDKKQTSLEGLSVNTRIKGKIPLRWARTMRNRSQTWFVQFGIPQSYISDYERGVKDHLTKSMKKLIEQKLMMVGQIDWSQ
jgi:predicted transcriptional regulator